MQQAARPEIVIAGPAPDMRAQVAQAAAVQAPAASVAKPVVDFSSVTLHAQYAYKFTKLQEFGGSRPGLLDKNEKEEVGSERKTIDGSNIHDLMRNIYVPSASLNVTGVGDLTIAFVKAKLPSTYISIRLMKPGIDPALGSAPQFESIESIHLRKKA